MELQTFMYVLAAALCAALVSFTMTPPVRVLAYKIGAIDVPLDKRRMHKKPIPRIGGLAIFSGFLVASLLFCPMSAPLKSIWIGGSILVIIGVLDDIFRLSALLKLAVQIIAALVPVFFGVTINHISLFGHVFVLGVWGIPFTVLWIVGLTNAINLIDGLDGLACGVSAICSASILGVMIIVGDTASALITVLITASCIGFLPFNKNPARIFMGDTGSLFLGYSLAVISTSGLFKLHTVISFLIPITVFALPLFDTIAAILRRVLSGRSPFAPDKGHLHHKLVDMGFTQKESVKILYAICSLMGIVAIVFTDTMFDSSRLVKALLLLLCAIIILVLNYIVMVNPASRLHSGLFDDENEEAYKKLQHKVELLNAENKEKKNECNSKIKNSDEGDSNNNEK